MRVAVIGAGAAGIISAKRFKDDGYNVVVFEQTDQVGGTWVYREETGPDVHSSMYKNLRTNLTKHSMSYINRPFPSNYPTFMSHQEVLEYLQNVAEQENVIQIVRFNTKVISIDPEDPKNSLTGSWKVVSKNLHTNEEIGEVFDKVAICNGHYSDPYIPNIPHLDKFKGEVTHSHDYRVNTPFEGKKVVIIGGAASSADISKEIMEVASEVHVCFRNTPLRTSSIPGLYFHGNIINVDENGDIVLADETVLSDIDNILFCTGYHFSFPFLCTESCHIEFGYKRVCDMYLHLLPFNSHHPQFNSKKKESTIAPSIGFIGLPLIIVPFPLFDYQAQFLSKIWKGDYSLPSPTEIRKAMNERREFLKQNNFVPHHEHLLGNMQFDYIRELVRIAPSIECDNIMKASKIYEATSEIRQNEPETYKNTQLVENDDGTFYFRKLCSLV